MAIKVTENWSGRWMSLCKPWRARRVFVVTGTADVVAALTAVDATGTGVSVPRALDAHPATPLLKAKGPEVQQVKGRTYWVISVEYELDPATQSSNPLDAPTEIEWAVCSLSEPVDVDLDNNPYLNSALDPLSDTRDISYLQLTLYKNLPYFDPATQKTYGHAVNKDPVTFMGAIQFPAEHLCLRSAIPCERYTADKPFVRHAFKFDGFLDDSLGKYPFQSRLLDAGDTGWYSDGAKKRKAKFSNGLGVELAGVRLDGTGKPLQRDFADAKVGRQNGDPVVPANAVKCYKKVWYDATTGLEQTAATASTQACFLIYKRAKVIDFGPLTALFST